MPLVYMVKNESKVDIATKWVEDLLPTVEYGQFQVFKKSEEYSKVPEGLKRNLNSFEKLQRWVTQRKLGELRDTPVSTINPDGGVAYMFVIKGGESKELAPRQWEVLKHFEKREIEQKIKYGQTVPDVIVTGFLTKKEVQRAVKPEELIDPRDGYEAKTLTGLRLHQQKTGGEMSVDSGVDNEIALKRTSWTKLQDMYAHLMTEVRPESKVQKVISRENIIKEILALRREQRNGTA